MTQAAKKEIRYTTLHQAKKTKRGGRILVSEALVKAGVSNLIPKMHVKRGDVVMLMSGSKKSGARQTGKVLSVYPKTGKVIVEGLNMVTRATKPRTTMGQSGLIKKEGPVFASRVMLYCTGCKKPTRIKHKILKEGKKVRVCHHCKESLDT